MFFWGFILETKLRFSFISIEFIISNVKYASPAWLTRMGDLQIFRYKYIEKKNIVNVTSIVDIILSLTPNHKITWRSKCRNIDRNSK